MKAISLYQPWGTLMALNEKRIETRSWSTSYRGLLAIASTAKSPLALTIDEAVFGEVVRRVAERTGEVEWPDGCILCIVKLIDCVPITPEFRRTVMRVEKALGNYADGRFAWVTLPVETLDPPIPVKGAQGLWEWERP
jgi:activating signal cointegrator 1